ncbi:hypothetical protein ACP4OV_025271 [Aristida adscensionis]
MAWSAIISYAGFLLLLLMPPPPCVSDDRLLPGKPLTPGAAIVSDGGAFALGFFSLSDATPAKLYLGIWYNDIPELTVVWVANRETPAMNSSSSSPPTLVLTNASDLVLSDAGGRVLWTTANGVVTGSGASPSPAPPAGAAAVLMNSGNLVVRSPNGAALWQSFEHPSDTLLPGMKIRVRYSTRAGERLVSWNGPGDPSPGPFSYGGDPATFLQLVLWNGTRPVMRNGPWTGFMVTTWYQANTSAIVYQAVVSSEEEIYFTYTLPDGSPRTRFVLTHAGVYELRRWNGGSSAWTVIGRQPKWECDRYGHCGPNGYCDHTAAAPTCRCLDGFVPASPEEWSGGRFSRGCRRRAAAPRCGDGFVALPGVVAPDKFVLVANRNAEECAAECGGNCSCVAYSYANLSTSRTKGDTTRCLVWAGELIDMAMVGAAAGAATDTLYLRVPGLDADVHAGRRAKGNALKIVLPAVLTSIILTLAGVSLACFKLKDNKRNREDRNGPFVGKGDPTQDFEFPFIKFEDIEAATHNFSEASKIGQGGFGKVYKAMLGGQEVAVKRLSRDSEQGTEEFRNEVILIAKLQHKNLVRLLGCSVEGPEKILIYEYLPNKSLDATLFDNSRKILLDWPVRLNIIKGIARGLLYLHQDSRLTIVHRDLKPANVLLDAEMRPKIADFGMARIFNDSQQNANTQRVVGTYGYMAPEYAMEGIFSVKSDVYSFGVLFLEVMTGTKRSSFNHLMGFPNLTTYAWNMWKQGNTKDLVDPSIADTCLPDEIMLCFHVALLCVQENPDDRPLMSYVVFTLENGSPALPTPNSPAYFAQTSNDMEQIRSNIENSINLLTLTNIEGR